MQKTLVCAAQLFFIGMLLMPGAFSFIENASAQTTTTAISCPDDFPVECIGGSCCPESNPYCCGGELCCPRETPYCCNYGKITAYCSYTPDCAASMTTESNCPSDGNECTDGTCCSPDRLFCCPKLNGTGSVCNILPYCLDGSDPEIACPVTFLAGETSPEAQLLRNFRGSVMQDTQDGEELTANYYAHAGEVVGILNQNPALKDRAQLLLSRVLPSVAAASGQGLKLDKKLTADIKDFGEALKKGAGPRLRHAIDLFLKRLEKGRLFSRSN